MHYTPELETEVRAWAQTQVTPERWPHVCGVVQAAAHLADRFAPSELARVRLAGWIHDAAKTWDSAALLDYAESHGWPVRPVERAMPDLLHGAVGYALAAERFGLDDALLQSACVFHTTGAPEMPVPARIVFVADLIEPTRTLRKVARVRRAARHDLDSAVLCAVDTVIKHLLRKQRLIDPRALDLRNALILAGVRYGK